MPGGLGGLGGWGDALSDILAGLGSSLLTSPRTNPLQGLPAGMLAAGKASTERQSQAAMVLALTKAGIDPGTAAVLAQNPTAAALMISQGNVAKTQALREQAIRGLGGSSLTPPDGSLAPAMGVLGGLGGDAAPAAPMAALEAAKAAIANNESAGSGGYSAIGPEVKGDRAYGKYQVMGSNIPEWTKKHLGKAMSVRDFVANPEAQDKVFEGEFGSYLQKYGNVKDAASMWFSGRPMAAAGNASDGYMTVPQYVAKVERFLGQPGRTQVAQADTGTATDALPTNQVAGPGARMPTALPDRTLPPVAPVPAGANKTKAWANGEAQNALRLMIAAGDDKGLMEAAKLKFENASKYLTPTEAQKNLETAGISPTSEIGRDVLTGGAGLNREKFGLERQKLGLEGEKFDFERYQKDREYRQQVDNANRTTTSKEYDLYAAQERSAGREPKSRFDYEVALKTAGASKIDLGEKRQSEFAKGADATMIKRFSGMVEEGDSSAADLSLIRQLRDMGGGINPKSLPALRGWLADRGVKIGDDIGLVEAYNSAIDRMTPAQRQGMPGAASDRDISMFRGSLPKLLNTPGGNAIITDTMEALALHKQQRAAIAERAILGELTPKEATDEIRKLPDPLATFKDFRSEGLQNEAADAPKQAPLIYTGKQYDALKIGDEYRDAKGNLRRKSQERPQ